MKKFLNKSLLTAVAVLSHQSLADNAPGHNEHNIGLGIQMQTSVNGLSGSGWDHDGKYVMKLDDINKKARNSMSMTPFTGYLSYSYMHAINNKFKVGVRLQGHIGKGLFVDLKEDLKDNKELLTAVAKKYAAGIGFDDASSNNWVSTSIMPFKGWNPTAANNIVTAVSPEGASNKDEALKLLDIDAGTFWHSTCSASKEGSEDAQQQTKKLCENYSGTNIHGDTAAALSWGVNLSAGVKYNITPKFYASLHAGYSLYSYAQAHAERFALKHNEDAFDNPVAAKSVKAAYGKLEDNKLFDVVSVEKAEENSVYTHAITTDLGLGYSITKNFSVEAHIGYEFDLGVIGDNDFYKSGVKQLIESDGALDEELKKPGELKQGGYEIDTGGLTYGATIVYTF